MRIIVHIGNYKTGTSSLQHFLKRNRKELLKNGIYYGQTWQIVDNHAGFAYGLLKEALYRLGIDKYDYIFDGVSLNPVSDVDKMIFMAKSQQCDTLIISHEGLFADLFQMTVGLESGINYKMIEAVDTQIVTILHEIIPDAQIVCYLRRQDMYVESMYNEYCKVPWSADAVLVCFDEFMDKQKLCFDYKHQIDIWNSIFGANCEFRPYNTDKLLKKDINYDFLHGYLRLSDEVIDRCSFNTVQDDNIRLCRDALEHKVKHAVNDPVLNQRYIMYSKSNPDAKYFGFMEDPFRQNFMSKYYKDNQSIWIPDNGFNENTLHYTKYPGLSLDKEREISRWLKSQIEGDLY